MFTLDDLVIVSKSGSLGSDLGKLQGSVIPADAGTAVYVSGSRALNKSYTAKRAAGDLMLKLRELSPRRRAGFSGEGSSTRPSAGLGGLEACRWPPCSICSTGRILPHG